MLIIKLVADVALPHRAGHEAEHRARVRPRRAVADDEDVERADAVTDGRGRGFGGRGGQPPGGSGHGSRLGRSGESVNAPAVATKRAVAIIGAIFTKSCSR